MKISVRFCVLDATTLVFIRHEASKSAWRALVLWSQPHLLSLTYLGNPTVSISSDRLKIIASSEGYTFSEQ